MKRVLAVLAGMLVVLLPCAPAAAHGGKVTLEVAGDGAAGVTVRATYADGHPVDDRILRLVLTATGDGGRSAGPVQLNPAGEGRGFYASGSVLGPGRWTVVVTAPGTEPGATGVRAEAVVETRAVQTAPPSAGAGAGPGSTAGSTAGSGAGAGDRGGADGDGDGADRAGGRSNGGGVGWWLFFGAVAAASAGLLVAARRSRHRSEQT